MPSDKSQYSAGIIFAVVASVIFGLIPLFSVPLLKAGLPVSNVVCYRFGFSTIAMALVMAVRCIPLKVTRREYGALLMIMVTLKQEKSVVGISLKQ